MSNIYLQFCIHSYIYIDVGQFRRFEIAKFCYMKPGFCRLPRPLGEFHDGRRATDKNDGLAPASQMVKQCQHWGGSVCLSYIKCPIDLRIETSFPWACVHQNLAAVIANMEFCRAGHVRHNFMQLYEGAASYMKKSVQRRQHCIDKVDRLSIESGVLFPGGINNSISATRPYRWPIDNVHEYMHWYKWASCRNLTTQFVLG